MTKRSLLLVTALSLLPFALQAQPGKSPTKAKAGKALDVRPPDDATRKAIADRLAKLRDALNRLRQQNLADDTLAEVEIFAKAAEWVERHREYFGDTARWTVRVLDDGLRRAEPAAGGEPAWRRQAGRSAVRAYRSRVDGSVQPYSVTLPADYGREPNQSWRLDVVLHGRDATLTEVKFLNQFRDRPAPKDQTFVQLDIFGRTNNAYRWAGETDVFEAIDAFLAGERRAGRSQLIDPRRVVLRGFSMGGAGAWHLGLHYPCKWAVIGPGAGFTTTRGYTRLPDPLPDYVAQCLHIYDAVDYAENAATVPVVAYAGEKDPQIQAGRNIEARLKPLGIPMTFLTAPDTEHRLTPEYAKKAEAEYAKYAGPGKGRPEPAEDVRFVTWTLKYPRCDWVELLGLERHYAPARVEAHHQSGRVEYDLKTANVRRLRVRLPATVGTNVVLSVDGESVPARPANVEGVGPHVTLEKVNGRWSVAAGEPARPEKSPGRQGPIDDAFTDVFLCVRGTGKPWHPATGRYATDNLERFAREWDKYLRGRLPVKDDTAVTDDDIRDRHLILFGDPASNSVISRVLPKLPLTWTRETVALAGASGYAAQHVPVLIYPNPLNPTKYVVLNSGHTFHADAFQGTNALLYPRLGDFALLRFAPMARDPLATETVKAGLFDEFWQTPH